MGPFGMWRSQRPVGCRRCGEVCNVVPQFVRKRMRVASVWWRCAAARCDGTVIAIVTARTKNAGGARARQQIFVLTVEFMFHPESTAGGTGLSAAEGLIGSNEMTSMCPPSPCRCPRPR